MEVKAKLKNANFSAQKGRLIANQIRGEAVESALNLLGFSSRKAADSFKKLLNSARKCLHAVGWLQTFIGDAFKAVSGSSSPRNNWLVTLPAVAT